MRKITVAMICFSILTLIVAASSVADYQITNSTTEDAWVVYAAWRSANGAWPEGWRTQGYYKIAPGETRNLQVPVGNRWVYIRVENTNGEMKPPDHATRDRFLFWRHPSKAFTVVENNDGDFLKSNHGRWSLERAYLYEYRNGGSHTLVDEPDLRAQHVYDQSIHSVVWIRTADAMGSGVLIDKARKLVVTNHHVLENAAWATVFFPWRDSNAELNKDQKFYMDNQQWLERWGYATQGRVVARSVRNDLAIVQLVSIPGDAYEIRHDFSRNVEDTLRRDDTVHIFGNPGTRLWNWSRGTFKNMCSFQNGATCLELEGDAHPGNSGGPVLNGQGLLIGILTVANDETLAAAIPTRSVKALLTTVPANLVTLLPKQTYPKQVFRIRNRTGVSVSYEIRWAHTNDWQLSTLQTGFIKTHVSDGQNVPSGYPKIRFDYIADDDAVTYRYYTLEATLFRENNTRAPTYFFRYNPWGDRINLFRDTAVAPTLSRDVPEETVLLPNYPNPFNPETWIPYQLAKPAAVDVRIYSADGRLIRTLTVGHQPAGVYQTRGRAAHWDGRNAVGEPVASGVYFYTLTVSGDFRATRKMLIKK